MHASLCFVQACTTSRQVVALVLKGCKGVRLPRGESFWSEE